MPERSAPRRSRVAPAWLPRVAARRVASVDGLSIFYEVLEPASPIGDGPRRTLLLANGLGGRLYAWGPLIDHFGAVDRIITWDFRGIFSSGIPERPERLAIPYHAEDALAILDQEGVHKCVAFGWSMGVQVALQAAVLAPERFSALVLMNGTHGQVLQTGFQPIFRLPFLSRHLHDVIDFLCAHPNYRDHIASLAKATVRQQLLAFYALHGRRALALRPVLEQYLDDVFATNFTGFLRLFQELDAHSVYHHLRHIHVPTMVCSGAFDPLTPAYQSREIARKMPDVEYLRVLRASHFVMLERPELVIPAVDDFLARRVPVSLKSGPQRDSRSTGGHTAPPEADR